MRYRTRNMARYLKTAAHRANVSHHGNVRHAASIIVAAFGLFVLLFIPAPVAAHGTVHANTIERGRSVVPSAPVPFDVDGDSVSALTYNGLPRAQLSWINWAVSTRTTYAGGFAVSGQRTDQIAAGSAATGLNAPVLVVLAGTNDVRQHVDPNVSMLYLDAIAKQASEARVKVIFSLIPPSDTQAADTEAYNALLTAHARALGWNLIDPWVSIRTAAGTYVPGYSYDGTHPNGLGQRESGPVFAAAIFAAGN